MKALSRCFFLTRLVKPRLLFSSCNPPSKIETWTSPPPPPHSCYLFWFVCFGNALTYKALDLCTLKPDLAPYLQTQKLRKATAWRKQGSQDEAAAAAAEEDQQQQR
jgi:hypothetical protein